MSAGAAPRFRMHPVTLRFADREQDRAFVAAHDADALANITLAGVLAIALYAAFAVLDTVVATGDLTGLLVLRFGVVCPTIAVLVLLMRRLRRVTWVQPGTCFVVVLASLCLDLMPIVGEVPDDYARTGTLLVLMFLFAFARVRFVWALPTTALVVGLYLASLGVEGASWETVVYNVFVLLSFIVVGAFACWSLERLRRIEHVREWQLAWERARSDRLLHEVLPEQIAGRLRDRAETIAEGAEDVSVLFADVVGFTPLSESLAPARVVELLDQLFTAFDERCGHHGLEKIKTIGDAYMAVAGVPRPDPDHAAAAAELALDLQEVVVRLAPTWPVPLQLRIGIASGPVVAGVIGRRRFAYDLWGDTVNTASRMESHGVPGAIQVAAATRDALEDRYAFSEPLERHVKGKGPMRTYLLLGRAAEPAPRPALSAAG